MPAIKVGDLDGFLLGSTLYTQQRLADLGREVPT
jgi:hypothetical protein